MIEFDPRFWIPVLAGWAAFVLMVVDRIIAFGALKQRYIDHEVADTRRHAENVTTLKEIRDDVRRINGKVIEHEVLLRLAGK